jgi:hypothetical protein
MERLINDIVKVRLIWMEEKLNKFKKIERKIF